MYMKLSLLISTYVVRERLSGMQKLPESGKAKICAQIGKNTLFWDLVQNTPSPLPPENWNLSIS